MLKLEDICVDYGDLSVLRKVNLELNPGKTVAVVGSNNSGKSTTLKAIAGLVPLKSGRIIFENADISNLPTHERAKLGITLIPEGWQLFNKMSVLDNLQIGSYLHRKKQAENKVRLAWVLDKFPNIKDKLSRDAGTLSGGERQMVSMGRGLMTAPKLMLVDEPSLGLAPIVVEQVFEILDDLRKEEFNILLVEQNLYAALLMSHKAYVIENGMVVMEGSGDELLNNPGVKEKYLGI